MLDIYTDGAKNGGGTGWAFVALLPAVEGQERVITSTGWGQDHYEATNNQMELMAVVEALKANRIADVRITSDSKYVVEGATDWIKGWIRNGWKTSDGKPISNRKLWQQVLNLTAGRQVLFQWVKGHKGDRFNELCDRLCTTASRGGDPSQHLTPTALLKPIPAPRKRPALSRKIKIPTHRHLKTNGLYEVLITENAFIEANKTPAVIYLAKDGTIWVRPKAEFFDGRFQAL